MFGCFDRTYEELKLSFGVLVALRRTPRFDRTYEELKPGGRIQPGASGEQGFDRTYEELKRGHLNSKEVRAERFDRTYEELKHYIEEGLKVAIRF